jgi:hypothetical protein
MDNDKEKSAIDKFKETVSDAVGNLASIVTPSADAEESSGDYQRAGLYP